MAHYTKIGGTNKSIIGGITKVGGTTKNIVKGITKIGGTKYDIPFGGAKLPIGGRIFLVDPSGNGATYTFYDRNKNVISNQTVSGLRNAMYYSVEGTPSKDKFYAYATNNGSPTATILTSPRGSWDPRDVYRGNTSDGIGAGKKNSELLLSLLGSTNGTIWLWINELNAAAQNGCKDWYVGSMAEINQLKNSGTASISAQLWSSVEYDQMSAYALVSNSWDTAWKSAPYYSLAIRSF